MPETTYGTSGTPYYMDQMSDPWAYLSSLIPKMQANETWLGTKGASLGSYFKKPGVNLGGMLGYLGAPSGLMGYANLAKILASQGRTDPAAFNQMLRGIGRGGESAQAGIDRQLAARGLENSGVGMALKQATTGATENRLAAARAQETQLTEQRKRQDLDLLLRLFVQPSLDVSAMNLGQYGSDQNRKSQEDAAKGQAIASTIAAIVAMFA